MKMRVLVVSAESRMGGAEQSLCLLVKHLGGRFGVWAGVPGGELAGRLEGLGVRWFPLPGRLIGRVFSGRWFVRWVRLNWAMVGILRRTKAGIVHANNARALSICVLPALLSGRDLIWHARDFVSHPLLERVCGWFCRHIIAVSKAVKDDLVRHGLAEERITVVYNRIEEECLGDLLPRKPRTDDTFTFANIGQFVRWKNQTAFIKAAALVLRQMPTARFLLVGDDVFGREPRYREELLELIRQEGLAEHMRVLGWQSDMGTVWPQVDCLVHTAEREPFGRVIVEAMAAGVAVIAVQGGGPAEIIVNGSTGVLVKSNDAKTLSEAMVKVAKNGSWVAQMIETG